MKQHLYFTLILSITSTTLLAQENVTDSREKITVGLKTGLNYSNVYDSEGEEFDADPKFGYVASVFLAVPIGKMIGIQPEVSFSQKGFQASGNILGGHYELTRTTSYLDIPVFFLIKPSEFFTVLAGPQFSYLIKQKDVFSNATSTVEQEQEFENDNIRKNTLCFVGGADINIKHIVLSARVGWDLFNNNGDGTSTTPRYKNVWAQATIGYRFY